eukprot:6202222-Pleurochrysis_carterae.AAC.5
MVCRRLHATDRIACQESIQTLSASRHPIRFCNFDSLHQLALGGHCLDGLGIEGVGKGSKTRSASVACCHRHSCPFERPWLTNK